MRPPFLVASISLMMTTTRKVRLVVFVFAVCFPLSLSYAFVVDMQPRTVVPDIAGHHGKTFPWSLYKDARGIIVNEGPRKENRVCYVQGICVRCEFVCIL